MFTPSVSEEAFKALDRIQFSNEPFWSDFRAVSGCLHKL